MCHKCVKKHNEHKLIDVNESGEKFCKQLKDDINEVSVYACQKQGEIKQLDIDTENLLEKFASTESEISQKYDQLISLIQSHQSQLMEELKLFKNKILKKIAIKKDEIERQFLISESLKRYCQEMVNKGTACDISRTALDLHAKAEELVKTQDERFDMNSIDITLVPFLATTNNVNNFIGELVLRGQAFFEDLGFLLSGF